MCGRFVQRYTWYDIDDLYHLAGAARNLQAHYNIAPTDPVDVVRSAAGGAAELVSMRWGLVPYWWKKPLKQVPATFNARAENDRRHTHVPRRLQTPSVHRAGERLLRVAQTPGRQAAVFH